MSPREIKPEAWFLRNPLLFFLLDSRGPVTHPFLSSSLFPVIFFSVSSLLYEHEKTHSIGYFNLGGKSPLVADAGLRLGLELVVWALVGPGSPPPPPGRLLRAPSNSATAVRFISGRVFFSPHRGWVRFGTSAAARLAAWVGPES